MRFDLDFSDRTIIHYLVNNNILSPIEAVIYTIVLTRPVGRDKSNLANLLILYRYPELSDLDEISEAIDNLVVKDFFFEVRQGSSSRIECADPIERLKQLNKDDQDDLEYQKIFRVLQEKKIELQEYLIETIGWANSGYSSDTYIQALNGASKIIKLPVFSAATQGRAKDAISQALARGVDVKLLMFSPELALATHGVGRDIEVSENAKAWLRMAKEQSNSIGKFEMRFVSKLPYSLLAGALLVDEELFRYDIYYPRFQRGHEGFMIQGRSFQGEASNLYKVLDYYFEVAWNNAEFPSIVRNILKKFYSWSVPLLGFILILFGLLIIGGQVPFFTTASTDYGLFALSLGLFPALTGVKKLFELFTSFEIRRRHK
jgi:hypothetical protein